MQRFTAIVVLTVLPLSFAGCSMCCGPNDFDYPTYGGIHQRADPAWGRVGSIFSDPFAQVAGLSADSNLEPYPEPRGRRDSGPFEGDDDLERQDEDLDDDLEELDRELESIDPLDDEPELDGANNDTTTAARQKWRRRR